MTLLKKRLHSNRPSIENVNRYFCSGIHENYKYYPRNSDDNIDVECIF